MATFPSGTVLIAPPSQVWSRAKVATLQNPKSTRYAATRAVDGSVGTHARSAFGTDALTIDLTTPRTPNIFGVFQHNVDWDLVCGVQAGTSNFGGIVLDRGVGARPPHFWLDLRGFLVTARYWRLVVNGNTRPLTLGEVVVATGFEFTGSLVSMASPLDHAWQARAELEYGKVAISASGAVQRSFDLQLKLDHLQEEQLRQVFTEAGMNGERVVVVPDTRRNDIFFVDWPSEELYRYPRSDRDEIEIGLRLVEENGGVV